MLGGGAIALAAVVYFGLLFTIASHGDRKARRTGHPRSRPVLYALTLGIYCTSWTFFGSVGLAATQGFNFLPIYIGPIIVMLAGGALLRRIARLAKAQNITSIADFIAARYGKSMTLAALVTVIAVLGTIPYISLQLKSMALSVTALMASGSGQPTPPPIIDMALIIALVMAAFAIAFGTRQIDATEHHDGLMLAIAAESLVKLFAFLIVGTFISISAFGNVAGFIEAVRTRPDISRLFLEQFSAVSWLTMLVLSMAAIMLLPRQFHVAIVENSHENDMKRATWLFPLYLVAINIFVIPIAIAGLVAFPDGQVDADMFVLALPMAEGRNIITLLAFIGGLSAATAMIIVAAVALSIMVCNNLVMPMILRRQLGLTERADMAPRLLNIRRGAILLILLLAYLYYHMVGDTAALASIGLLSFAAIAQFAPAFFGGLFWHRANAKGAAAGILCGFALWSYTLLLPSFAAAGWIGQELLETGPVGLAILRPQHLFYLDMSPLTHGVFWSLGINGLAYVLVSINSRSSPIERLQASLFTAGEFDLPTHGSRLGRSQVTVGELKVAVARYLGDIRTRRAFRDYDISRQHFPDDNAIADIRQMRFAENMLASAMGAASSRLAMALLLARGQSGSSEAIRMLDDASEAIQYNRDLLQSALDHVRQGLGVFDSDTRLVCWNRQFRRHLGLPPEYGRIGVPLQDIILYNARRGEFGDMPPDQSLNMWIDNIVRRMHTFQQRLQSTGRVLEMRTDAMPGGGLVLTVSDITESVEAAEKLERVNATLERRVRERTAELTRLNARLERSRSLAEAANHSKTRFLAAASHDILQPLNAARLYTSSIVEMCHRKGAVQEHELTSKLDSSLESVEEIMSALLDIARLDAGAMKPDFTAVSIQELFTQLAIEYEPLARGKNLQLRIIPSSVHVRSDRRLLRRILQNLLSNAIKYTTHGKVLMGCRRRGEQVCIEVHDSGPGIEPGQQKLVFQEFKRLENNRASVQGLGLGLSIVDRMAVILNHPLDLRSTIGTGSVFSVTLPMTAAPSPGQATRPRRLAGQQPMNSLHALCIDNEPKILDGMRTLLGGWGCAVTIAGSRQEAIATIRAATPATMPTILLVDYHLGDGDGLETITRLREIAAMQIPAILITANRSRDVREAADELGIPILNKPIKPAALRALINQMHLQNAFM